MRQHAIESIDPRSLGRRLQDARKTRGLTQREVAEHLAVARTTVAALERGDRRPRPGELMRMARLYARPLGCFVGAREPAGDLAGQFRAAVTGAGSPDDQRELGQAVRRFQGLCEDYLHLEGLAGASLARSYPAQHGIEGTPSRDAAEDVASSEHNRLGLGDGPVLRLRDVLESDVGIRIFSIELPSRVTGMFAYTEELGGCIAVNALHPEERRRWSMAHEYGHFLTRRSRPEVSTLGTYGTVPATGKFADAFAGAMLMPAAGLRRRFNDLSRGSGGAVTAADACGLAHRYLVPVEAMMLRLEQLRLLPAGAWDRLRDRGLGIREAQDQVDHSRHPGGGQELPHRYRLLAARAYGEGQLTEGELARLLRTDRVSARRVVQEMTRPLQVLEHGEVGSLLVELSTGIG